MELFVTTVRELVEYHNTQREMDYTALRAGIANHMRTLETEFGHVREENFFALYDKFLAGVEMCEADGATEDGITMLYATYMRGTLGNALAGLFVYAARYMLKGGEGSINGVKGLVSIPGLDEDEEPDILLDFELNDLVKSIVGNTDIYNSMVQFRSMWMSQQHMHLFYTMQDVAYGYLALQMCCTVAAACKVDMAQLLAYWLVYDRNARPTLV